MVSGYPTQQVGDHRAGDAAPAVPDRGPHVDQVGVADPVGEQPRGTHDAIADPGDAGVCAGREGPVQLVGGAAVVEPVPAQVGLDGGPVDAGEIVAEYEHPPKIRLRGTPRGVPLREECPAASYSPTLLRVQYHRRWRA